jgi:hypothetical protein
MDLLANSPGEVVPGTLVQQFWCNPEWTSEDWFLPAIADPGDRLLVTKVNVLCGEIENRSTAEGARLRLNRCNSGERAQQFRFDLWW